MAKHLAAISFCAAFLAGTLLPSVASAQPFAYVPNAGSGTVTVIDISTNTVVATVSVGAYPRGAALGPNGSGEIAPGHRRGSHRERSGRGRSWCAWKRRTSRGD